MKKLSLILLLLVLPCLVGPVHSVEVDTRYYVIAKGEQNFGKSRIIHSETPEYLRWKVENVISFSIMGFAQEARDSIDLEIDKNSKDRTIQIVSQSVMRNRTMEVKISGKRATLVDFAKPDKKLEWQETVPLYFETDYLLFKGVNGFKLGVVEEFRGLNIENQVMETISVVLKGTREDELRGTLYTFFIDRPLFDSTEEYDSDFNLIQGSHSLLDLEIRETLELPEIDCFDICDGDFLEFRRTLDIADSSEVDGLLVTLVFNNVKMDKMSFTALGQTLVKRAKKDSEIMIRVATKRENLQSKFKVNLPVKNQDQVAEEFCQPSRYVLSTSPKTKELLKTLHTKSMNLAQLIAAVNEWMLTNITQDTVIDLLDSDEIMAHKKGMCMHFGTLFAALMRGAGVPTRCVVGELYVEDRFLPHLWNEVWNGQEWLPVDMTIPFSGLTNPLAIKLGEGNDMVELGNLKSKLLNKMDMQDIQVVKKAEK